jgi:small-conductance mechanosensitive channel
MSDHEKIMETPPPMALFIGFGDGSLDFRLLFWTNDFDNWLSLQSEINVKVNNELKESGIEIPFPQRDLHIRSIDKDIKLTSPNK